MAYQSFDFESSEKLNVHVLKWVPGDGVKVRAVLQIAHGMAEHAERYDHFAAALNEQGIVCYANDHRGHGKTARTSDDIGFFADKDGWQKVIEDMHTLNLYIKKEYPDTPVFILGHSMGSILLRNYISLYGSEIYGALISGTAGHPGVLGMIGSWIAGAEKMIRGKRSRSNLLNNMMFDGFNKMFKPNRTDFDWLSRDDKEVDKYIADPLCGNVFTTSFYTDFLKAILRISRPETAAGTPKDLPIFIFSGDKDPVGDNAKGVKQVFDQYKKTGITDVTMKLYPGGRHEMLNEVNRAEVYGDVIAWLDRHLPA